MALDLLKEVRSLRQLDAAWRVVRTNGLSSKSKSARKEIQVFADDAAHNLRSLQARLRCNSYKFRPARGVPIKKPGKKTIRPLVITDVESRIVQRAILDVLLSVQALQPYFRNPHSFGGIKRGKEDTLAAVPAAIEAVLEAIKAGACYIACADISSFFTRISKDAVTNIVADAVRAEDFMALFRQAIHVELANLATLRYKKRFPTEDLGVAQGNALSPLLGNIILSNFDGQMNEGDCRCIRYIDDFIILGPSAAAVMARLRRARTILHGLDMTLATDKTSNEAIPVTRTFEFLGIEFSNTLIRPSSKARAKFLTSLRGTFNESREAFKAYRNGQPLSKTSAFLGTLKRVDGIIQGWGKHYRFCNDDLFFSNLDEEVGQLIREYIGTYRSEWHSAKPARAPALLGVELLSSMERKPFKWHWPKKQTAQAA